MNCNQGVKMSKLLNELNDKQRLAAENFEGPL